MSAADGNAVDPGEIAFVGNLHIELMQNPLIIEDVVDELGGDANGWICF